MGAELTRRDRLQAAARLDELAEELEAISGWLDRNGERHSTEDKAAVLLECAIRDIRAACWVIKPAGHPLPEGWLAPSNGHPAG